MEKWEYLTAESEDFYRGWVNIYPPVPSLKDKRQEQKVSLNDLGKQGWELVALVQSEGSPHRYVFKRRLP